MLVLDGFGATEKIRQSSHPQAKTIPIIAMTADAFDDELKHAIESGMNGYITKPVDPDKLFATISENFILKNN